MPKSTDECNNDYDTNTVYDIDPNSYKIITINIEKEIYRNKNNN